MSMSLPSRATIETTVENIPDAILEAGFRPGQQLRIQVEYIDDDEDTPPGFVLIESHGKRILSGVTMDTMPQAIRKLALRAGQKFSIRVEDDEDTTSRMERLLAKAGAGVALVGPQKTEDIDTRIREFRGEE